VPRIPPTLALAASLLPQIALARTVVLAPIVGSDPKLTTNVTSLVSSELEFMTSIDDLVELRSRPGTLTASCVSTGSCLSAIGKSNGGDQVVAGQITESGGARKLELVLYDLKSGRIVVRKNAELPKGNEEIAEAMPDLVRALFSGASATAAASSASKSAPSKAAKPSPTAEAAPAPAPSTHIDDDFDDIELIEDEPVAEKSPAKGAKKSETADAAKKRAEAEAAQKRAEAEATRKRAEAEEARKRAEAEEARKRAEAEEARKRAEAEEARKRAEEAEAKRRAEAEATRKRAEAEEARKRAEAEEARKREADAARSRSAASAPSNDDFDPNAISFGPSSGSMQVEEIKSGVLDLGDEGFDAPKPSSETAAGELDDEFIPPPKPKPVPPSSPPPATASPTAKPESAKVAAPKPASSNGTAKKPAPSKSAKPKTHLVEIAVRGGYSRYYQFGFISGGGELALALAPHVFAVGGVEAWSIQRAVPPDLQRDGQTREWNVLLPGNVGVVYKGGRGAVRPYIGADGVFTSYYRDENGQSSIAAGARLRAGADFMVSDHFGFNANLAAGFWSGKNWTLIEEGVGTAGLLSQGSAGLTFAF
jgi:hypothetical protein